MAELEGSIIRQNDQTGRLVAAGFEWIEPRILLRKVGMYVIIAGGFVSVAGLIDVFRIGEDIMEARWFWLGLAIMASMAVVIRLFGQRHRAVIFERGGKIATPYGFPGYPRRKEVRGHFADISSIEIEFIVEVWVVVMYSVSGNVVHFGVQAYKNYAHKVSVQLNRALIEIRAAESDPQRHEAERFRPDNGSPTIY